MCGIAGIYNYADPDRPVDRDLLGRMTRLLAHRGPDAEAFFVRDNVGLGHRRLSIVDLTPTGAQPMVNDDGSCCITYNGEFYNHRDFRDRLAARGSRFRGTSDTETLLRLMEIEGPDALAETAGIFAFGFWDGRSKRLTLARDHLGVKQLYFHDDGRRIVFASEIKALLEDPEVPRDPDPEAINQYLHFHTPLFDRTFFRHIRQLRAGDYMVVNRWSARVVTYWELNDFEKLSGSDESLIDDLRDRLSSVVKGQLMADVPVGSFFSGGIDSSAVAAFASQTGTRPACFGVHFSGQGVTDERPYQEAAAKALGLDLHLITMDGSTFPDDVRRLMYYQDEPVIGSAMFPMSVVSQLASREVKVCLGGQAADEIFGGYARYALGNPTHVLRSWYSGRRAAPDPLARVSGEATVGPSLAPQFAEGRTIYRLAKNLRHLIHWESRYFEHFANVPEHVWLGIFSGPEFCSRDRAKQIFRECVNRSSASKPMDKIMHWDLQTYLTGLFHQDDRMSMASSLESRVPFADPRLVNFAFKLDPDIRFRGGASKWILRKAVSNVLPSLVLSRRKVGFDTPAEAWMHQHRDFVHDTLLSSGSIQRSFWNRRGIESLLASGSFDALWKVFSVELWASIFLDSSAPRVLSTQTSGVTAGSGESEETPTPLGRRIRYLARECVELGAKGTITRTAWEVKTRAGLTRLYTSESSEPEGHPISEISRRLPFASPARVAGTIGPLIPPAESARLSWLASQATRGRIQSFGRWMADFGSPIDWHRDPVNEHRFGSDSHWANALRGAHGVDVKFTWEAARFPQAFFFARAACFNPAAAPDLAAAFSAQVLSFIVSNPPGRGIHWFSGQEIALRIFSWLFGMHVFSAFNLVPDNLRREITGSLADSAIHIGRHIEYARDSVYNNHLLSEALGLYMAGTLLNGADAEEWKKKGLDLLVEQADRQIYRDGAYIQCSHNYHRVAMQMYLLATALRRAGAEPVPQPWIAAMERSLDFLLAHQNESDGRLPNYGPNDGALPLGLSACDFSDFRPVLQALSVATRQERIYSAGPWDETAVWLSGPEVLDLPVRRHRTVSVSFPDTGYHVLRGNRAGSFCAFRCGTIPDRFSQIDMLHLDIWWRGRNVLVDGGSYRYNGAHKWHNHFFRTASHNTVQIDGRDQMPHVRQFKTLYRTKARLLRFEDTAEWAICAGEHYGYLRHERCIHRRAVLMLKDEDVWVVVDTVIGKGSHRVRLQWLAGDYPYQFNSSRARLVLETTAGPFSVSVLDRSGSPAESCDVAAGSEDPPRGWVSRYYGEKIPAPSLAASASGALPLALVTLACPGSPLIQVSEDNWTITIADRNIHFRIEDGVFRNIALEPQPVSELQS